MEVLPCDVGGESHILSRRVPVGIDACRECGVGGGVEPFASAVLLYERRSVRSAHMECELPWVGAVGGVAVYAAAGVGGVLEYRCLVEVGEAALVDAHLVVVHITRCYASVGESPVVERRVADIHRECGVACPFAVAPARRARSRALPSRFFSSSACHSSMSISTLPALVWSVPPFVPLTVRSMRSAPPQTSKFIGAMPTGTVTRSSRGNICGSRVSFFSFLGCCRTP